MGKLASASRFHTINPINQFTYILQDPLSSGAELKISIAVQSHCSRPKQIHFVLL
jgi:hypothetical protein